MSLNKYSIYIPSKGRYDKNLTADLFLQNEIPFRLVVEPQDERGYVKAFGRSKVLILHENDRGVAYVRNWIKKYSALAGEKYHWQIDDDIRTFKRRIENKNVKTNPLDVLLEVEAEVDKYSNIGQAGITSDVFAFSSKKDIYINRQIYSVMLFNNEVPVSFRENTIDDLDYSLQVLSSGWCTLFFTRIMFELMPTMKQKGGNTDLEYVGDRREKLYEKIIADYPGWFQFRDKRNSRGILTVKPSRIWKTFTQQPILKETE